MLVFCSWSLKSFVSLWRRAYARDVRLYYPYRQYMHASTYLYFDLYLNTAYAAQLRLIFCPNNILFNIWFILKQLDNFSLLSMSDSQLGCASYSDYLLIDNSDSLWLSFDTIHFLF